MPRHGSKGIIAAEREKAQYKKYTSALGLFVDQYAAAEAFVHLCFARFAKMNRDLAMAIKGAMRLSDLMALTKRVMVVKRWPEEDRALIERAFTHLNDISEFRDRVLHRGAYVDSEGNLLSTNVATMKSFDLMETVNFKIKDVEDATEDLRAIQRLISLVAYRRKVMKRYGPELIDEELKQPWRYRPVKPESLRQQFEKVQRTRERQQKSSPGK